MCGECRANGARVLCECDANGDDMWALSVAVRGEFITETRRHGDDDGKWPRMNADFELRLFGSVEILASDPCKRLFLNHEGAKARRNSKISHRVIVPSWYKMSISTKPDYFCFEPRRR